MVHITPRELIHPIDLITGRLSPLTTFTQRAIASHPLGWLFSKTQEITRTGQGVEERNLHAL